jgi:uncharacterized protein YjbI with pentapeptide repeats
MAMESPEERKLKPDGNPWYLLATLYGQQTADYNEQLHATNRVAWNRYMAPTLGDDRRALLIKEGRHLAEELTPFSPEELEAVEKTFVERSAQRESTAIPDLKSSKIDFSNIQFDGGFSAEGFLFPDQCDFSDAIFCGDASFVGATFFVGARFRRATFSDRALFGDAAFYCSTDFSGATFSELADFWGATFSGATDFGEKTDFACATFSGEARFQRANFVGWANFLGATFSDLVSFSGVSFPLQGTRFRGATFSELAEFRGATFSGEADFEDATFRLEASFVNVEMKGPTFFRAAVFSSAPPRFFGAKLHEGTVWRDVIWPKRPKNAADAGGFVDAYERLKLEMNRLGKHEDELDFFARELQSRRIMLHRPTFGLAIALYGLLCDYGRSYVRPLLGLLFTTAAGAIPLYVYFNAYVHFSAAQFSRAIGVSLANTFGIFGFRKDFVSPELIDTLPGGTQSCRCPTNVCWRGASLSLWSGNP